MIFLLFRYIEPPDGGWGWVIVAAVWVDNMLVIGMLKSLGVLFPAFRTYFDENASAISWINSISLSMRATAGKLQRAMYLVLVHVRQYGTVRSKFEDGVLKKFTVPY